MSNKGKHLCVICRRYYDEAEMEDTIDGWLCHECFDGENDYIEDEPIDWTDNGSPIYSWEL